MATKIGVLAFTIMILVSTLMWWSVEASRDAGPLWRLLAIVGPLVPPVLVSLFITRFIVYRLTAPVMNAYRRLAAGDFTVELPRLTAGSDFMPLRETFAAMRSALEQSLDDVREADLARRRLFADLAHELATPTSTLLGIAAALREKRGDTTMLLTHLDQESHRLERLIADIREVAHLEDPALPLEMRRTNLAEVAERVAARARLGAAEGCKVSCNAANVEVLADPTRLEQVLTNLLDNASRYARGGKVLLTVAATDDGAQLTVEDSGPGVPDELLPELGRRLMRVDPSRSRDTGGHGLGLSIVRAIVARHGGTVAFGRSTLGGLRVDVCLDEAGEAPDALTSRARRGSARDSTSAE